MILCFEAGGKLYVYSLSSQQQKEVKVTVVTDEAMLKPKIESVEKIIAAYIAKPRWQPCAGRSKRRYFFLACKRRFYKKTLPEQVALQKDTLPIHPMEKLWLTGAILLANMNYGLQM